MKLTCNYIVNSIPEIKDINEYSLYLLFQRVVCFCLGRLLFLSRNTILQLPHILVQYKIFNSQTFLSNYHLERIRLVKLIYLLNQSSFNYFPTSYGYCERPRCFLRKIKYTYNSKIKHMKLIFSSFYTLILLKNKYLAKKKRER